MLLPWSRSSVSHVVTTVLHSHVSLHNCDWMALLHCSYPLLPALTIFHLTSTWSVSLGRRGAMQTSCSGLDPLQSLSSACWGSLRQSITFYWCCGSLSIKEGKPMPSCFSRSTGLLPRETLLDYSVAKTPLLKITSPSFPEFVGDQTKQNRKQTEAKLWGPLSWDVNWNHRSEGSRQGQNITMLRETDGLTQEKP